MADGIVQVPPDSTGKKIDTAELTRPDGAIVERQRITIPDLVTVDSDLDRAILVELRITNYLLMLGLNINVDLDALRADPTFY